MQESGHTAWMRTALTKLGITALAASLLLLAAGCSGSHESHEMSDMASATASGMAGSGDAMFAQMMIPHHQQAVVMADLASTRAASPVIKELAAEIKAAQQPEIDQMSAWLAEWGMPVMEGDEAMSSHGGHGMAGMLTDEQLDSLAAASGPEFDQLFAEYMILHHEGAIDMAEDVVDSSNPEVATLAAAIISTQDAEITQLQAFLDQSAE
jgi:uncharacterized protein (DUF305 family)